MSYVPLIIWFSFFRGGLSQFSPRQGPKGTAHISHGRKDIKSQPLVTAPTSTDFEFSIDRHLCRYLFLMITNLIFIAGFMF